MNQAQTALDVYTGGGFDIHDISLFQIAATGWVLTVSWSALRTGGLLITVEDISIGLHNLITGDNYLKIQLWRPPVVTNLFSLQPTTVPSLWIVFVSCSKHDVLMFVIFQFLELSGSSSNFHAKFSSLPAKSTVFPKCGLRGIRVRRLIMYQEFGSPEVLDLKHFEWARVHWNCHCLRCCDSIRGSGAGKRIGGLWS